MASLNPLTKELVFKIVFYGPGLGGKTTTLQFIHASTKPENRGKMVSLATPMDRTLYFDFLPIRVPRIRGMGVRLQLFTVPGQVYYGATRKLVLTGADGIVFVADSQAGRQDANLESLEDLITNLADHNRAFAQVPHTFQWNKRDLSDLVPMDELDRRYNRHGAPSLGTVATRGEGVFEGLERITTLVVRAYEAELPKSERTLDVGAGGVDEAGIADAIRGLAEATAARPRTTPSGGTPAPSSKPSKPTSSPAAKPSPAPTPQPSPKPRLFAAEAPTSTEDLPPPTPPPATRVPTGEEGRTDGPLSGKSAKTTPAPSAGAFSFASLWPESDREAVRDVEAALAVGEASKALLACDALVTRILASTGGIAGSADAPRDPAVVVLLLGLDGARYLGFRASVRAARQGETLGLREALDGYAFALEARRAREAILP